MKQALEGLLYLVGDEGITFDEIKEVLEIDENKTTQIIEELVSEYENENRGLEIKKYGNIYKFTTKKIYSNYYKKLADLSSIRNLSQSALETLAIIAYNCPITRAEVDEMRGISSSQMIRNLMAKDFIKEVGKKDCIGKPILYGVTDAFLDYFNLESVEDLPKPEDKELVDNDDINLYESKYVENE